MLTIVTKNSGLIAFAELHTDAGIIEAVFFPNVYTIYEKKLQKGGPINLYGKLQEECQDEDGSIIGSKLIVEEFQ